MTSIVPTVSLDVPDDCGGEGDSAMNDGLPT